MEPIFEILEYIGSIIPTPIFWSIEEKIIHTAVVLLLLLIGGAVGLSFRSKTKPKKKYLIWGCLAVLLPTAVVYLLILDIVDLFLVKVFLSALFAVSLGIVLTRAQYS